MVNLSPRQELLQLQKRIYRKNKHLIEESVIHEDETFVRYEHQYLSAVKDFQALSSFEEMEKALVHAQIVYVGDYHTLNQSQRSFLRTLRSFVQKNTQFVVGLEVIQAQHQHYLDQFMKGRIGVKTFLKKTGFHEHWFFDLWTNFELLFDFFKYHDIPVYGIEGDPRASPSLKVRDQITAKNIFEIAQKNPNKIIFVFVGDLHLAPSHLPKEVKKLFQQKKMPLKTVTLYQNSNSIYWKLAEQELENDVLVVKISDHEFCRMNTPPIICQQSYLNWLEHEEGVLDFADAHQVVLGYLEQIAGFLDITLGPEKDEVQVYTCGDLSFLKRLRENKAFSPKEIREIKRQIIRSESYTIPKRKIIYLANVSINHAAEEVSHMLRHLCAGEEFARPMQDAFYANILHEAMGFFGSKIINHKRKCLRLFDYKKLVSYLETSKTIENRLLEYHIAKLFLEHETRMATHEPFHANKISALSVDLFLGVTHAIGYALGEKMFYGLIREKVNKDYIKKLFCDPMEEDGEPLRWYFDLETKLKGVRLPKKRS